MAESKLILCVCGAGINTSLNAKNLIMEHLQAEGLYDVEVKHAMIGDIAPYKGRKNMVVVWMTQIDQGMNAPSVQGLPFMIGSRKAKVALSQEIVALMDKIYEA